MTCGIYKITNLINNKVYIGQSVEIERRWQKHKNYYKNKENHKYKIYRAMYKYGIENFSFEIIEICQPKQLNERQIYWISYYNSLQNGYNMTSGGDGIINCNDKPVNQYDSNGKFLNTYKSAHEAERQTQICFTNICKVCRKERPHAGGYIWRYVSDTSPIEPIKITRIVRGTHVLQYSLLGEPLHEFKSLAEAEKQTGINSVSIGRVCKGKQKTAGGYIWKLKGEE